MLFNSRIWNLFYSRNGAVGPFYVSHEELIDAVATGDAEAAQSAVAHHLEIVRTDPASRLRIRSRSTRDMSIRCGVVGIGYIGRRHVETYRGTEGCKVVGIVEPDPAAASRVTAEFGVPTYASIDELLDAGVDAVSICSPTAYHAAAATSALELGVHVLVEKPMASTTDGCRTMLDAAARTGAILMVGFTHRFHSELRVARALIDAGELGAVRLASDSFSYGQTSPWPDWWYDRELSGGGEVMHDGVHLIDRMAWLLGSRVHTVFGATSHHARGVPHVEDGAAGMPALRERRGGQPVHQPGAVSDRCTGSQPAAAWSLHPGAARHAGSLRYETWDRLSFDSQRSSFTIFAGRITTSPTNWRSSSPRSGTSGRRASPARTGSTRWRWRRPSTRPAPAAPRCLSPQRHSRSRVGQARPYQPTRYLPFGRRPRLRGTFAM